MIPRGTLDIAWRDLGAGLARCCWSDPAALLQARVAAAWAAPAATLVCLSVRSGFDLLLQALSWPVGSEVLVSAITIPDMVRILHHHGLVPIPIDIDPATLAINVDTVTHAIGPRTKAILIAHLFGSRMPLDPIMRVAQQHGLIVLEDCAQAYDGVFRGHPDSDVRMFSFGPIKTQTALGGAVLEVNDAALLTRMRHRQARYPRQRRRAYLRRLLVAALLKFFAHPLRFTIFVALCRWLRRNHDDVVNQAVRGFGGVDLIARIRQQPAAPLLHMLERRLTQVDPARIVQRSGWIRRLLALLPSAARPGSAAAAHTHWVVPIFSSRPEALVRLLWAHGFDATRRASSLISVAPAPTHPTLDPIHARFMLDRLVYLPLGRRLDSYEIARLGQLLRDSENSLG